MKISEIIDDLRERKFLTQAEFADRLKPEYGRDLPLLADLTEVPARGPEAAVLSQCATVLGKPFKQEVHVWIAEQELRLPKFQQQDMVDIASFCMPLRQLRIHQKLSQGQLAANAAVPNLVVARIERGMRQTNRQGEVWVSRGEFNGLVEALGGPNTGQKQWLQEQSARISALRTR